MKRILIIFVVLLTVLLSAQTANNLVKIAEFKEASSFSVNGKDEIVVSDRSTNEIIRIDTNGTVIQKVGGYGWNELTFDDPADLYAATLNVIVADQNNNRLQILDKDLNFLSYFNSAGNEDNNMSFSYPSSVTVSATGDIFILDSDNSYILKYNYNGNFISVIGSENAGGNELEEPTYITFTGNNLLAAADGNSLKLFDEFGNTVRKIPLNFKITKISSAGPYLLMNNDDNVYILSLRKNSVKQVTFSSEIAEKIVKVMLYKKNLYLLTSTALYKGKLIAE